MLLGKLERSSIGGLLPALEVGGRAGSEPAGRQAGRQAWGIDRADLAGCTPVSGCARCWPLATGPRQRAQRCMHTPAPAGGVPAAQRKQQPRAARCPQAARPLHAAATSSGSGRRSSGGGRAHSSGGAAARGGRWSCSSRPAAHPSGHYAPGRRIHRCAARRARAPLHHTAPHRTALPRSPCRTTARAAVIAACADAPAYRAAPRRPPRPAHLLRSLRHLPQDQQAGGRARGGQPLLLGGRCSQLHMHRGAVPGYQPPADWAAVRGAARRRAARGSGR
jgi:hypothetical protein